MESFPPGTGPPFFFFLYPFPQKNQRVSSPLFTKVIRPFRWNHHFQSLTRAATFFFFFSSSRKILPLVVRSPFPLQVNNDSSLFRRITHFLSFSSGNRHPFSRKKTVIAPLPPFENRFLTFFPPRVPRRFPKSSTNFSRFRKVLAVPLSRANRCSFSPSLTACANRPFFRHFRPIISPVRSLKSTGRLSPHVLIHCIFLPPFSIFFRSAIWLILGFPFEIVLSERPFFLSQRGVTSPHQERGPPPFPSPQFQEM